MVGAWIVKFREKVLVREQYTLFNARQSVNQGLVSWKGAPKHTARRKDDALTRSKLRLVTSQVDTTYELHVQHEAIHLSSRDKHKSGAAFARSYDLYMMEPFVVADGEIAMERMCEPVCDALRQKDEIFLLLVCGYQDRGIDHFACSVVTSLYAAVMTIRVKAREEKVSVLWASLMDRLRPRSLPVETFFQAFSFGRGTLVYRPLTVLELAQPEFLADLALIQSSWKILLVCKHEQLRVLELLFGQHSK